MNFKYFEFRRELIMISRDYEKRDKIAKSYDLESTKNKKKRRKERLKAPGKV